MSQRHRRRRAKLRRLSELIGGAFGMIGDGEDIEGTAHEIAHAVLLFQKPFHGLSGHIEHRCERMRDHEANRHEVRACALEVAGLRALGFKGRIDLIGSMENLRGAHRRLTLLTKRDFLRAVNAERPSKRNIARFVAVWKAFERWA